MQASEPVQFRFRCSRALFPYAIGTAPRVNNPEQISETTRRIKLIIVEVYPASPDKKIEIRVKAMVFRSNIFDISML